MKFFRIVAACAALLTVPACAADLTGHKIVSLVSPGGKQLKIAEVDLRPSRGGYRFVLKFTRHEFVDTYMEETNFLCLPAGQREICHFPFPPGDYAPDDSTGYITQTDLHGLEYALLFVHKRPAPAEVDINPFNGMYYRLGIVGDHIEGTVFGVDFNHLVVAGEHDRYPLKPGDLDAVDLRDEPFPHLVIE